MENLRTFEEYRHFKFRPRNYIGRTNIKDPNEPFFNRKKREYFDEIRNRNQAEQNRRNNEIRNNEINHSKEKYFEQKPLVEKYLDILKNHKEQVLMIAYKDKSDKESMEYFGLKLKDKSVLVSCVFNDKYVLDDSRYNILKINNEKIYQWKETIYSESDPYGEENYDNDTKNEVDELWLLIIEIVKDSREYFQKTLR